MVDPGFGSSLHEVVKIATIFDLTKESSANSPPQTWRGLRQGAKGYSPVYAAVVVFAASFVVANGITRVSN